MAHRLRETFAEQSGLFQGPVEIDETYIGGKRRNMSAKRREQFEGRGAVGKAAVVGIRDRYSNRVNVKYVEDTKAQTVYPFIHDNVRPGAKIYTDESLIYASLDNHESVKHSIMEFVRGDVHTNGVESFWSMLKRGYTGTFHKISFKHLQRYVDEFAGRHNIRELDTIDQMAFVAMALVGRRLKWKDLIS